MLLPRPVARFTPMPLRSSFRIECRDIVRGVLIALEKSLSWRVFVTCFAGFRSDVLSRIRYALITAAASLLLCLAFVLRVRRCQGHQRHQGSSNRNSRKDRDSALREAAHLQLLFLNDAAAATVAGRLLPNRVLSCGNALWLIHNTCLFASTLGRDTSLQYWQKIQSSDYPASFLLLAMEGHLRNSGCTLPRRSGGARKHFLRVP